MDGPTHTYAKEPVMHWMSRVLAAFRAGIRRSVWAEREGLTRAILALALRARCARLVRLHDELMFAAAPLIPRLRSGPPSPRRSGVLRRRYRGEVEPKGSNPALAHTNKSEKRVKAPSSHFYIHIGGEGGIRTLEGLLTLTPLAGARLRPLGHLSGRTSIRGARDDTRPEQSR